MSTGRPTGEARRGRKPPAPEPAVEPDADPEEIARAICLRLLSAAPRTRAELAKALARRRVPRDAAEAVLDRFTEVGLLDDAAFANAWVQSRHAGRGLGRRALSSELAARGVARDVAARAVEAVDPDSERAAAEDLVRRRLPSTAGLDYPVRLRRLANLLVRRGHSPQVAFDVVRTALADQQVIGDISDDAWQDTVG